MKGRIISSKLEEYNRSSSLVVWLLLVLMCIKLNILPAQHLVQGPLHKIGQRHQAKVGVTCY